jgi:flagellar assembly factor FliW
VTADVSTLETLEAVPGDASPGETAGDAESTAELTFRRGLPGFPGERHFTLVRWGDDDSPYSLLIDLESPELRFLVAPPSIFFPSYEVDLDDATVANLDLRSAEEALLLIIISATDRAETATANLLGPLVINTRTRQGVQAILAESGYGTRVPLLPVAA